MKITRKDEANYVEKPGGPNVRYYLFDEYEMHHNEQPPHSTQDWHHHDRVWETILVLEGEMTALWKEGEEVHEAKVAEGDVAEIGQSIHTFENRSDEVAKFLVIKQVLRGENNRELFKTDKIVEE